MSQENQDGQSPGAEQSVPSWKFGQSQIRESVDGWSALPRRQTLGIVATGEGWVAAFIAVAPDRTVVCVMAPGR